MKLSFSARVTAPEGVLMREIGGEAVLLNLENEKYYGLNGVGAHMWTALTSAPSVQAAYETLLDEFDVQPEQLRQDLESLIAGLAEHGLVTVAQPVESLA